MEGSGTHQIRLSAIWALDGSPDPMPGAPCAVPWVARLARYVGSPTLLSGEATFRMLTSLNISMRNYSLTFSVIGVCFLTAKSMALEARPENWLRRVVPKEPVANRAFDTVLI